jgi:hypothetical protein
VREIIPCRDRHCCQRLSRPAKRCNQDEILLFVIPGFCLSVSPGSSSSIRPQRLFISCSTPQQVAVTPGPRPKVVAPHYDEPNQKKVERTPYTLDSFRVHGVNLAHYGLEQDHGVPPTSLVSDNMELHDGFTLRADLLRDFKDRSTLLEFRKRLQSPNLAFYYDKSPRSGGCGKDLFPSMTAVSAATHCTTCHPWNSMCMFFGAGLRGKLEPRHW